LERVQNDLSVQYCTHCRPDRGSPLGSGGLTVVNQIIEDKLGQPVRIVLAGLRMSDDC
jgi:hypothetical protein